MSEDLRRPPEWWTRLAREEHDQLSNELADRIRQLDEHCRQCDRCISGAIRLAWLSEIDVDWHEPRANLRYKADLCEEGIRQVEALSALYHKVHPDG